MNTIELDEAKLPEILDAIPQDKPIVMLNLLKFNQDTNYSDSSSYESCRGEEAYNERYLKNAAEKIHGIGGEIVYDGNVCVEVVGENKEGWDRIIVVRYPSIALFMQMVSTPEYVAIREHRAAALEDSRLIATVENG